MIRQDLQPVEGEEWWTRYDRYEKWWTIQDIWPVEGVEWWTRYDRHEKWWTVHDRWPVEGEEWWIRHNLQTDKQTLYVKPLAFFVPYFNCQFQIQSEASL